LLAKSAGDKQREETETIKRIRDEKENK